MMYAFICGLLNLILGIVFGYLIGSKYYQKFSNFVLFDLPLTHIETIRKELEKFKDEKGIQ